jgi:hypothetical protein
VFIDPISDVVELDETDQREVRVVRDVLKQIVSETGVCLGVIHHSTKSASSQNTDGPRVADMSNMRGSGIFQGTADLMLELRRTEFPNISSVHMVKARDQKPEPVSEIERIDIGAGEVRVEWRRGIEAENQRENRRQEKRARRKLERERAAESAQEQLQAQILEFLRDNPGSSKSAIEVVTGKQKATRRAFELLRKAGRIIPRGKGWAVSIRLTYRKPALDTDENEAA